MNWNLKDNKYTDIESNEHYNKWEWTGYGTGKAILNTYLNNNPEGFYKKLPQEYQEKIVNYQWQIGGINWNNYYNKIVPEVYQAELGQNKINKDNMLSEPTKIGLMYISDYLYAALPNNWILCGFSGYNDGDELKDYRSAYTEDWMYSNDFPWTISRVSNISDAVFAIINHGGIVNRNANLSDFAVHPVFYLEPDVTFSSGTGTETDPFII